MACSNMGSQSFYGADNLIHRPSSKGGNSIVSYLKMSTFELCKSTRCTQRKENHYHAYVNTLIYILCSTCHTKHSTDKWNSTLNFVCEFHLIRFLFCNRQFILSELKIFYFIFLPTHSIYIIFILQENPIIHIFYILSIVFSCNREYMVHVKWWEMSKISGH